MKTLISLITRSVLKNDERRRISALIDVQWYKRKYRKHLKPLENPISHWISKGWRMGLDPHPLFSVSHYLKNRTLDKNTNPLIHYLDIGWHENYSPHPLFDATWYLTTNPDVAQSGMNPLEHYIRFGAKEGRRPYPVVHSVFGGQRTEQFGSKQAKQLAANANRTRPGNRWIANSSMLSGFLVEKEDAEFAALLRQANRNDGHSLELSVSEDTRLISFDVWDTLLRRDCHPDEIKLMAARYLMVNHYWKLLPAFRDIPSLMKARQQAENCVSHTADYEYRYAEAAPIWLSEVFERGVPEATIAKICGDLIEHEYKAESRSTRCDRACVDFLAQAKMPALLFASDFYMPSDFLRKLLVEKKIPDVFVKGYSSSDIFKTKRSGDMFAHILEEFDAQSHELMHVGDNPHADVVVPQSLGVRAHHYLVDREEKLKQWFGKALAERLHGKSNLHAKRILALLEDLACNAPPPGKSTLSTSLFRLGIRLAPIAIGFVLNIIEHAKRHDVRKVFFFTREGVFLRELFDRMTQNDPYLTTYPSSAVLEVSRLATFAASIQSIDAKQLMRIWTLYSKQSPHALCRSLNLDTPQAQEIFEQGGLVYDRVITYPWKHAGFMRVLTSSQFRKFAEPHLDDQRKRLYRYFSNKGFEPNQRLDLVVDLGWRGTIQDNLAHIFPQHLHGCYLGLFKFLNQQPSNLSKTGWLFDNNNPEETWGECEVAPLEMLFNSPGGSVSYYAIDSEGEPVAHRVIDETEEAVFQKYTAWLQKGILETVPVLTDYIAVHALTADDLREPARQLVDVLLEKPPADFAEAFFELSHNETFGTGAYHDNTGITKQFLEGYEKYSGSKLHAFAQRFFSQVRWPAGFLQLSGVKEMVRKDRSEKAKSLPFKYFCALQGLDGTGIPRIGIFAPAPLIGSGGHRTIYNMARKFINAGCEVFCFLEDEGQGIQAAIDYLGGSRAHVSVGWPNYLELDMAIATIAHSASFVAGLKKAAQKAYLVQDYEAYFNPVGDAYTIAENSFTYGLLHFTIGNWLSHLLASQYHALAVPAGLGIDTTAYYQDEGVKREKAICFLYQPEKPRRNPALGIEALKIVKLKHPDVKIYVYGSDSPINLDFETENLGLIKKLSDMNALYNKCEVGLCISMSNPSRIPFEMMASGCVPVDLYRYNNLFDYEPGTIKLAYQTPDSLAQAICELLENRTALLRRRSACLAFASTRTLDWETDVIVNSALMVFQGKYPQKIPLAPTYKEKPSIANKDKTKSVAAFCEWQRRLATGNQ